MRMTIHNGRAGKNGAYNPRHNDRQFDISHAEHIDPERVKSNIYWNWTGDPGKTFEAAEAAFYEKHCREYLDAVNRRHREQRHPERVRDMDAYRTARQTCPEETLLMIGNKNEYLPPRTLRAICEKLKDWEENTVSGLRVLDMALHVDEEGPQNCNGQNIAQIFYKFWHFLTLPEKSKRKQPCGNCAGTGNQNH